MTDEIPSDPFTRTLWAGSLTDDEIEQSRRLVERAGWPATVSMADALVQLKGLAKYLQEKTS